MRSIISEVPYAFIWMKYRDAALWMLKAFEKSGPDQASDPEGNLSQTIQINTLVTLMARLLNDTSFV